MLMDEEVIEYNIFYANKLDFTSYKLVMLLIQLLSFDTCIILYLDICFKATENIELWAKLVNW